MGDSGTALSLGAAPYRSLLHLHGRFNYTTTDHHSLIAFVITRRRYPHCFFRLCYHPVSGTAVSPHSYFIREAHINPLSYLVKITR